MFSTAKFFLNKHRAKHIPLDLRVSPALDLYVLCAASLVLPLTIGPWLLISLLLTPLIISSSIYLSTLPRPTSEPSGNGFRIFLWLNAPFAALAIIIGLVTASTIFLYSVVVGIPVALVRTAMRGGDVQWLRNNFALLKPHCRLRGFRVTDLARGVLGQMDMLGPFPAVWGTPFLGGLASSVTIMPIVKYVVGCNPLLYELEEVYTNHWIDWQIPGMRTAHDVKRALTGIVSSTKRGPQVSYVARTDLFHAFYPKAQGCEAVLGTQALSDTPRMFAFTSTEFAKDEDPTRLNENQLPVFRVSLGYFTMHMLTSYVEVNVTKELGFDHAMFSICAKQGALSRFNVHFASFIFVPFLENVADVITEYSKENSVELV